MNKFPHISLADSMSSVIPLNPILDITNIVEEILKNLSSKYYSYQYNIIVMKELYNTLETDLTEYSKTRKIRKFNFVLTEEEYNTIKVTINVTLLTDDTIPLIFTLEKRHGVEARLINQLDILIDDYLKNGEQ